jgi:hypothetical protein
VLIADIAGRWSCGAPSNRPLERRRAEEGLIAANVLTSGLQDGWHVLRLRIRLTGFVHKIEDDCRSPKPFSTIFETPNAIRFRKLFHECLNEWIRHFVQCLNEGIRQCFGFALLWCIDKS